MMGIFGESSSPYDEAVDKVTAENLTTENWALMMDICDRVVSDGPKGAKQCLLSIKKRLNHRDPHVVLFALSLLDCLWNNSNAQFRREVSSQDFINELTYRSTGSNRLVGEKTRLLIKKWAESECKKDPSLSLIETLYRDLLAEGMSFESSEKPKRVEFSKDPNVVNSEQEEADIAKAIALSLSEQGSNNKYSSQSYQPKAAAPQRQRNEPSVQFKVKALYKFEAVEDNEISFVEGDVVNVFDASDVNWWRGQLERGGKVGLFPATFVGDLNAEPPVVAVVEEEKPQVQEIRIDEEPMKRCIELLEQGDPTGVTPDDPELAYVEQLSHAQAPLIEQKLAQIDKQHNMLAQLDVKIREVLATYDRAVQQAHVQISQNGTPQPPQRPQVPYGAQQNIPPQQHPQMQMPQAIHPQMAQPMHPQMPQAAHMQYPGNIPQPSISTQPPVSIQQQPMQMAGIQQYNPNYQQHPSLPQNVQHQYQQQ